jgi:hypothetical protein
MNTTLKQANNVATNAANKVSSFVAAPVNAVSSFVAAPVNAMATAANNFANSIKNVANNVGVTNTASNIANSVKNVANNTGISNIMEPLNESVKVTMENTPEPLVLVPVIVALGVFIVLFIVVVTFRDQIALGLELAWAKLKSVFGASKPAVQPPPPEFVPDAVAEQVDASTVEKILPGKKEVFNISINKYTYSDADPLCKAFGAELATYDQVKDAWKKGADWCNYGWVKGQSAVYPTQQSTFDKLQAGPEDQRMACGMPGINGGYFDNPEIKFGVNCYGAKPSENEADARASMKETANLTPEALAVDRKILDYKAHRNEIPLNPFKPGTWAA